MPTEENLTPQLPPINFEKYNEATGISIINTQHPITEILKDWELQKTYIKSEDLAEKFSEDFPAYQSNPIYIKSFVEKATIMLSKEKPKKIGIIGSDGCTYNFLLKCDKLGDLRKEQRFIEFANLCNKMLENDNESRKRNLKLRTYAIVPLSRTSGLIEWIQNTQTLKNIASQQWKKNNVKGEMTDVRQKAINVKLGDTHEFIWDMVKQDIKPILG